MTVERSFIFIYLTKTGFLKIAYYFPFYRCIKVLLNICSYEWAKLVNLGRVCSKKTLLKYFISLLAGSSREGQSKSYLRCPWEDLILKPCLLGMLCSKHLEPILVQRIYSWKPLNTSLHNGFQKTFGLVWKHTEYPGVNFAHLHLFIY